MTHITRNMLRHSLLQMMAQPHMHLPEDHQQMPLRCKALHQADQGPPYLQYYCHSNTTSSTVIRHGRASGQQQTAAACHHCSSTCAINCTGPDSQKPLSVSASLNGWQETVSAHSCLSFNFVIVSSGIHSQQTAL